MPDPILHPIHGWASVFAHRLALEARLLRAAEQGSFRRDLIDTARTWFGPSTKKGRRS